MTQEDVDSGSRGPWHQTSAGHQRAGEDARAEDGFVKIFCRCREPWSEPWWWPSASELIYPLALAVELGLNVDDLATTFTVYARPEWFDRRGSTPAAPSRLGTANADRQVAPVCGRHRRFPRYWDEFAAFTAACVCARLRFGAAHNAERQSRSGPCTRRRAGLKSSESAATRVPRNSP